ncbi:6-pyruvoyl tetrahydropterin synthase family protein [Natronorubrum sp. A-ect3]|uniref:6-pyruvoyl trahydropterin synthase family protein n=1 Tax=Natronorubrum sp. A-ect3 TaxID=3242698 RepID=UPI00359ED105
MYDVSVSRSFVAQHFLTVPDPGPEGDLHSHHYTLEVTVSAPELDEYGYVVDIDDLSAAVDTAVEAYRDQTLNDCPAFEGLNPSLEHFTRIVADRLLEDGQLSTETATSIRIAMDEDDIARVGHERDLSGNKSRAE